MKTCKVCDAQFVPTHSSTQRVCGWPCGLVDTRNKAKKKADKAHTERKKDFKLHDVPHQHELTQPRFNLMRRLEEVAYYQHMGLEPECISCGRTNTPWEGSHLKPVGSHSEHRYEPKNVHLGCHTCNQYKSGNPEGYTKGLARRYGDYEAFLIIDKLEQRKVRKWTGEELVAMRKEFNKKIRKLESET